MPTVSHIPVVAPSMNSNTLNSKELFATTKFTVWLDCHVPLKPEFVESSSTRSTNCVNGSHPGRRLALMTARTWPAVSVPGGGIIVPIQVLSDPNVSQKVSAAQLGLATIVSSATRMRVDILVDVMDFIGGPFS